MRGQDKRWPWPPDEQPSPRKRMAPRQKAPRVGERQSSFAGGGRRTTLSPRRPCKRASRRRHASLPTSLRTGNQRHARDKRCLKRSGLGQSLHREQSRWGASRVGFSAPDPAYLRRFACIPGQPSMTGVVPITPRWFGMFEWSMVVLAETFICRSRGSARGLEVERE